MKKIAKFLLLLGLLPLNTLFSVEIADFQALNDLPAITEIFRQDWPNLTSGRQL